MMTPLPPETPGSVRPQITADLMARTGLDEAILADLVHGFYDRVRADPLLGPVFADRVSDWPSHLEKMVAFWSSVALMTGRYHGAPMARHLPLPVEQTHFERWLLLFRQSAEEVCTPEGAAHVIARARRIAASILAGIDAARNSKDRTGPPPQSPTGETAMQTELPPEGSAELTRFIETRYHQTHRTDLADLTELAWKVERVHANDPQAPLGLADLLQDLVGTLEVHMKKEELILFPAIRRGGGPGIENPIAAMRADHGDHEAEVARIRTLTQDLTLPEGACRSWTALYNGLTTFLSDLDAHIRLENDVLFPRFETSNA